MENLNLRNVTKEVTKDFTYIDEYGSMPYLKLADILKEIGFKVVVERIDIEKYRATLLAPEGYICGVKTRNSDTVDPDLTTITTNNKLSAIPELLKTLSGNELVYTGDKFSKHFTEDMAERYTIKLPFIIVF